MVSVEADIYADSLTQEQVMTAAVASYGLTSDTVVVSREQTERSHTGRILEQILQELPVTGLMQTPDGWYGRLNSSVHLSNLTANKNVRIQETITVRFIFNSAIRQIWSGCMRQFSDDEISDVKFTKT